MYTPGSSGSYFRRSVTRRERRHGCALVREGRRKKRDLRACTATSWGGKARREKQRERERANEKRGEESGATRWPRR